MNSTKISAAVAAILGASVAQTAVAAEEEAAGGGIQEVVVTAQRRAESIQNVPITIQALTSETLSQLNVATADDTIRYLPNVQLSTNGPGQGNIFMRGLSVGSAGTQSSGTIGGFPNVAVYLDEQSGQLPSRNLDVYAVDLERIEILEGPQGTLFGGGAEAGVVRYITNKPKLNRTEGSAEASYGTTAHGDPNTAVHAVINLPILQDKVAVRGVIYSDRRGGYIDNVPSTFTRRDTDLGIYYANYATGCSVGAPVNGVCGPGAKVTGYGVPPGSPVINNYNIARSAQNPVTYQGARVSALFQFTDDWSLLLGQTWQNMEADGVFYQTPKSSEGVALKPLEATVFNPAYNKDKFSNTAWTLNGKLPWYDIRAVYTGGYMVRNVEQVNDYTNYTRGVYADYYQCYGPGGGKFSAGNQYAMYKVGDPNLKSTCFSPSAYWSEKERNTHQSHELRFSTPDDWRIRAIVGGFWEEYQIYDRTDWFYKTMPPCTGAEGPAPSGTGCLTNVGPPPGSYVTDPSTRNANDAFFEDVRRGYKQTAEFASIDLDVIPKVLTVTGGARHYEYKIDEIGSVNTSFGCFEFGAPPCYVYSTNITAENERATYSGTRARGNVTWHVLPDLMVYYTFSQGYRPGGFNRKGGTALPGTDGNPQYFKPLAYAPDTLTNNEVGWKTQWFENRLQFNGSYYQEKWKNVQTALFNPGVLGNLTFGTNGPDYKVKGFELQVTAVPLPGLSITGSGSWNNSEQTNSPFLIANNCGQNPKIPASNNCGKPITQYVFRGQVKPVTNTFGTTGTPTAYSPPLQWNLRARYDWKISNYAPFVQIGVTHTGHQFNQTANYINGDTIPYINTTLLRYEMKGYSLWDMAIGVSKDNWTAQFYGQNMSNENASVFTSSAQFIKAEVPVRPRVMGLKVNVKF